MDLIDLVPANLGERAARGIQIVRSHCKGTVTVPTVSESLSRQGIPGTGPVDFNSMTMRHLCAVKYCPR